jgi:hypothetical protein
MIIERRAHPRRRNMPMAVETPHALSAAKNTAIVSVIAFKGSGDSSGVSNRAERRAVHTIDPAKSNVPALPRMVRMALTRIPSHLGIVLPV